MKSFSLLLTFGCLASAVSAQSRVGSGTDSSPFQLDLFTPGVDLRSTDDLSVIQRIEDSDGTTWYVRQQGALFALYPRGIKPNPTSTDQIPPGTRWFIGIQNLQQELGISPVIRQPMPSGTQTSSFTWPTTEAFNTLISRSESPNADRWLSDESYRQRAVKRWIRFASLR